MHVLEPQRRRSLGAPAPTRGRPGRSAASASLKAAADDWGTTYTTQLDTCTDRGRETYNSYVRVRTLGKGSSGAVELCADRVTGQLRALKFISRKRQRRLALTRARSSAAARVASGVEAAAHDIDELTDVAREVSVLGRLKCLPGVVYLHEVIGEFRVRDANLPLSSCIMLRRPLGMDARSR